MSLQDPSDAPDQPEPDRPEPDVKDWTWTLDRVCGECGFDSRDVERAAVPALVRLAMSRFADALGRPDATRRPSARTWSVLEYSCHVRDVCIIFAGRVDLMRSQHEPRFADWDQDATALEQRYWTQDPHVVAREVAAASEVAATAFDRVGADEWRRRGFRSNGSEFTVDSLARYFLHDLSHHVWDIGVRDIGGGPARPPRPGAFAGVTASGTGNDPSAPPADRTDDPMTASPVTTVDAGPRKVARRVTIDAPAADLFAIVADPHRHPELDGSGTVRDVPVEGPSRLSRGATFTVGMKQLGLPYKIRSTVIDFIEGRVIEWQHPLGHTWRWETAEIGPSTTEVTETFDYSRAKAPALLEILGVPARNAGGIEATLEALAARYA